LLLKFDVRKIFGVLSVGISIWAIRGLAVGAARFQKVFWFCLLIMLDGLGWTPWFYGYFGVNHTL